MFWAHDQAKEVNRVDYRELDNCVAKHQATKQGTLKDLGISLDAADEAWHWPSLALMLEPKMYAY